MAVKILTVQCEVLLRTKLPTGSTIYATPPLFWTAAPKIWSRPAVAISDTTTPAADTASMEIGAGREGTAGGQRRQKKKENCIEAKGKGRAAGARRHGMHQEPSLPVGKTSLPHEYKSQLEV